MACFNFTPERYERCPVLFSRLRFARTSSRCSRPPICSRPRRTASPRVRRSTRPSITPPTISPQLRSMRAPADINNLLDGIGNGVQVLQAANIGITSLQKLVDSAKSVANQALQTTVGFSTKSSFTSVVIDGATADNLVADQAPINAAFTGAASPQRAAYTSTTADRGHPARDRPARPTRPLRRFCRPSPLPGSLLPTRWSSTARRSPSKRARMASSVRATPIRWASAAR